MKFVTVCKCVPDFFILGDNLTILSDPIYEQIGHPWPWMKRLKPDTFIRMSAIRVSLHQRLEVDLSAGGTSGSGKLEKLSVSEKCGLLLMRLTN